MGGGVGYLSHFNLMRNQALANTDYRISNVSRSMWVTLEVISRLAFMFRWGMTWAKQLLVQLTSLKTHILKAGMIGASNTGWFYCSHWPWGRYRFNDLTIEGDRSGVDEYANKNGKIQLSTTLTLENIKRQPYWVLLGITICWCLFRANEAENAWLRRSERIGITYWRHHHVCILLATSKGFRP